MYAVKDITGLLLVAVLFVNSYYYEEAHEMAAIRSLADFGCGGVYERSAERSYP